MLPDPSLWLIVVPHEKLSSTAAKLWFRQPCSQSYFQS